MKRCVVLLVTVLTAVCGCARQAPQAAESPSASPVAAVLSVGTTTDETTRVLAELYVQGLVSKGRAARAVEVQDDANTEVSRLMSGELDVVPTFAWTAAQALQVNSDEADTLVSDLAAALDGEVAVLQPSKVDRAWRFVSTSASGSLATMPKGTTIVASTRWKAAPDGLSGLEAVYAAKPTVTTVDDPAARLAQVQSGSIGVFDGTDPQATDPSVHQLDDPRSMIAADPQLALLRSELATDDTVLDVIQQLHGKLDNAAVIGIKVRAASLGVSSAVAEWLTANPLA